MWWKKNIILLIFLLWGALIIGGSGVVELGRKSYLGPAETKYFFNCFGYNPGARRASHHPSFIVLVFIKRMSRGGASKIFFVTPQV